MALLYKVENSGLSDPHPIEVAPKNGRSFTLDELKELVGGWIQIVWVNNKECLVMDEEGKFKHGFSINRICTKLAHDARVIMPSDFIVGDVVLCNTKEIGEDDTDY